MNGGCHDNRHIRFAAHLHCSPEIVQETFIEAGVDRFEDRQELADTIKARDAYEKAYGHVKKANAALSGLPEADVLAFGLRGISWANKFEHILEELDAAYKLSADVATKVSGRGAPNVKANQIAEFVALLFEKLGKEIRYGKSGSEYSPSTPFGKAVKKALEVYDVRVPLSSQEMKHVKDVSVQKWGKLADWNNPTQRAVSARKPKT